MKDDTISAIRETSVLVSFHGGYYNWKRRDQKAEQTVATAHGISGNVGQYHKNLFAGADALLASMKALVTEARAYHYLVTNPSPYDGEAFLMNVAIAPYKAKMIEFTHRQEQLNAQIETEWASMQQAAKTVLGPLFNSNEYPTIEQVKADSYIKTVCKPIPSGENIILQGVDAQLRQEIADSVDSELREAYKAANLTAWKRLLDIIDNARVNLAKGKGDGRFRTEWHDNLSQLLEVMDGLNITGDADLHDFSQKAASLLNVSPDVLKEDEDERSNMADKAEDIFRDMSVMFSSIGGK
jgi:hypothetical protein